MDKIFSAWDVSNFLTANIPLRVCCGSGSVKQKWADGDAETLRRYSGAQGCYGSANFDGGAK